jgi:hypothetical protein
MTYSVEASVYRSIHHSVESIMFIMVGHTTLAVPSTSMWVEAWLKHVLDMQVGLITSLMS